MDDNLDCVITKKKYAFWLIAEYHASTLRFQEDEVSLRVG